MRYSLKDKLRWKNFQWDAAERIPHKRYYQVC